MRKSRQETQQDPDDGSPTTTADSGLALEWLAWGRSLQAISQSGLTYAVDQYDRERYEAVRRIAAEIIARHFQIDATRVEGMFADQDGYATPKVDVRAAIFRAGQMLLVQEIADAGRWTLPGGWADVNESPSEAIVREVREESGYQVAVRKLAAVYDQNVYPQAPIHPFHAYKLFFICEITAGSARPGVETSAVEFFSEDSLPEVSLGRVLPYQIHRMFEHYRLSSLPTEFD